MAGLEPATITSVYCHAHHPVEVPPPGLIARTVHNTDNHVILEISIVINRVRLCSLRWLCQ